MSMPCEYSEDPCPLDEHTPSPPHLPKMGERCLKAVQCTWYYQCRQEKECKPKCPEPECPPINRPTRPPGQSTGRIDNPAPIGSGDLNNPNPPGVFPGPRSQLYLPYLFMRANAGDLGARPVQGPFWESPDIFILSGVTPSLAPPLPPRLGQVGLANQPNTIYAHVWNFGNAAASEVLVEFYWCDPSLGINPNSVHLIAQTTVSLGAKGSGHSHAVVKCPEAWVPTYVNGGHECLLVRVWDDPADLPGEPKFDASINRHVAQRNLLDVNEHRKRRKSAVQTAITRSF